jgi:hypothetical protein
MEYFKGVVWEKPDEKFESFGVYRYVVVGMLVTDKPVDELSHETLKGMCLSGTTFGLAETLRLIPKFKINRQMRSADANSILCGLGRLEDEVEPQEFNTSSQKKPQKNTRKKGKRE